MSERWNGEPLPGPIISWTFEDDPPRVTTLPALHHAPGYVWIIPPEGRPHLVPRSAAMPRVTVTDVVEHPPWSSPGALGFDLAGEQPSPGVTDSPDPLRHSAVNCVMTLNRRSGCPACDPSSEPCEAGRDEPRDDGACSLVDAHLHGEVYLVSGESEIPADAEVYATLDDAMDACPWIDTWQRQRHGDRWESWGQTGSDWREIVRREVRVSGAGA